MIDMKLIKLITVRLPSNPPADILAPRSSRATYRFERIENAAAAR